MSKSKFDNENLYFAATVLGGIKSFYEHTSEPAIPFETLEMENIPHALIIASSVAIGSLAYKKMQQKNHGLLGLVAGAACIATGIVAGATGGVVIHKIINALEPTEQRHHHRWEDRAKASADFDDNQKATNFPENTISYRDAALCFVA